MAGPSIPRAPPSAHPLPAAARVTKRFHRQFRGCEFDKLSHIFK